MTIRQKRAISYAISKRKHDRQERYLIENGLVQDFENSRYKSLTWYLKSMGVRI